jgi:hypothetical protein
VELFVNLCGAFLLRWPASSSYRPSSSLSALRPPSSLILPLADEVPDQERVLSTPHALTEQNRLPGPSSYSGSLEENDAHSNQSKRSFIFLFVLSLNVEPLPDDSKRRVFDDKEYFALTRVTSSTSLTFLLPHKTPHGTLNIVYEILLN